jgi:hypothetical protein
MDALVKPVDQAAATALAATAVADIDAWRRREMPAHCPQGRGAAAAAAAAAVPPPITVCLVKRPLSETESRELGTANERGQHQFDAVSVSHPHAFTHAFAYGDRGVARLQRAGIRTRSYGPFDHAFSEVDGTDVVYDAAVAGLVGLAVEGGRATCIAYGQTGAGKTYTCTRLTERLVEDLYTAAADAGCDIRVSFFENQGERCYDLLNARAPLVLREGAGGEVHAVGLTTCAGGTSPSELRRTLRRASELRARAPTQTHPASSRSHSILVFRVAPTGGKGGGDQAGGGVLRVVDLAGSERHESASVSGLTARPHQPRAAPLRPVPRLLGRRVASEHVIDHRPRRTRRSESTR